MVSDSARTKLSTVTGSADSIPALTRVSGGSFQVPSRASAYGQ